MSTEYPASLDAALNNILGSWITLTFYLKTEIRLSEYLQNSIFTRRSCKHKVHEWSHRI